MDHANNNRLIQYDQPWLPFAIPSTNSSFENCFRYAPANLSDVDGSIVGIGQCNAQSFDVTKKIECTEFVYRSDEKNLQTEVTIAAIFTSSLQRYNTQALYNNRFFVSVQYTLRGQLQASFHRNRK